MIIWSSNPARHFHKILLHTQTYDLPWALLATSLHSPISRGFLNYFVSLNLILHHPCPSPPPSWSQVQTQTYTPPFNHPWSQKMGPSLVRKGQVYILQSSVLHILHTMTVVSSLLLSYLFNPCLTYFLSIKSDINIINLTFNTPPRWWCHNMTMVILWIPNSCRCFTQHYNLRVPTLDMSRSLTTPFQIVTTLALTFLPNHLASLHPHMPPPVEFRYPPERRLPAAPSHDHSYTRTGISMDSDHRSSVLPSSAHSETSPPAAESSTSPKDAPKETSSVVIACRQWWVLFSIIPFI